MLMKSKREEGQYEIAGREVAEKDLVPAIWSKAFSESLGNQQVALALYIKFRVAQLEAEFQRETTAKEEASKSNETDNFYYGLLGLTFVAAIFGLFALAFVVFRWMFR